MDELPLFATRPLRRGQPLPQVSDQRLQNRDPLRLRRDQRITRISGWLLRRRRIGHSRNNPGTTLSHPSNTTPAAKT